MGQGFSLFFFSFFVFKSRAIKSSLHSSLFIWLTFCHLRQSWREEELKRHYYNFLYIFSAALSLIYFAGCSLEIAYTSFHLIIVFHVPNAFRWKVSFFSFVPKRKELQRQQNMLTIQISIFSTAKLNWIDDKLKENQFFIIWSDFLYLFCGSLFEGVTNITPTVFTNSQTFRVMWTFFSLTVTDWFLKTHSYWWNEQKCFCWKIAKALWWEKRKHATPAMPVIAYYFDRTILMDISLLVSLGELQIPMTNRPLCECVYVSAIWHPKFGIFLRPLQVVIILTLWNNCALKSDLDFLSFRMPKWPTRY